MSETQKSAESAAAATDESPDKSAEQQVADSTQASGGAPDASAQSVSASAVTVVEPQSGSAQSNGQPAAPGQGAMPRRTRSPDAAAVNEHNVLTAKRSRAAKSAAQTKMTKGKAKGVYDAKKDTDQKHSESAPALTKRGARSRGRPSKRAAKSRSPSPPATAAAAAATTAVRDKPQRAIRSRAQTSNPYMTPARHSVAPAPVRSAVRSNRSNTASRADGGMGVLDRTRREVKSGSSVADASAAARGSRAICDGHDSDPESNGSGTSSDDPDYNPPSGNDDRSDRDSTSAESQSERSGPQSPPARNRKSKSERQRRRHHSRRSADSVVTDSENENTSDADEVSIKDENFTEMVLASLRELGGQTAVKYIQSQSFNSSRVRKDALHLAQFFDVCRRDPKKGLELISRRLIGLLAADKTGNWTMAEVLDADLANVSIISRDVELRLMKEANKLDKLTRTADKSKRIASAGAGAGRSYFARRAGGRGGRQSYQSRRPVHTGSQPRANNNAPSQHPTSHQQPTVAAGSTPTRRFGGAGGRY